jgi:hypothetical protein
MAKKLRQPAAPESELSPSKSALENLNSNLTKLELAHSTSLGQATESIPRLLGTVSHRRQSDPTALPLSKLARRRDRIM